MFFFFTLISLLKKIEDRKNSWCVGRFQIYFFQFSTLYNQGNRLHFLDSFILFILFLLLLFIFLFFFYYCHFFFIFYYFFIITFFNFFFISLISIISFISFFFLSSTHVLSKGSDVRTALLSKKNGKRYEIKKNIIKKN